VVAWLVAGCTLTGTGEPAIDSLTTGGLPTAAAEGETAGGACAPGQIVLADGPPAPPQSTGTAAEAPDGSWLVTDNSAECACALKFSATIVGGNRVVPVGCRHPGLTMAARFALAGDELLLLAANGETVMFRLRGLGPAHFEGRMNGRAVVLWQPRSGD